MSPKGKEMKVPPPVIKNEIPPAVEESDDDAESMAHVPVFPENIQKRINALKNIHMDIQKIEQDMHTKLFLVEAEYYKKIASLLSKRTEVVVGSRDPTEEESKFKLKEADEDPETIPADGSKGIPKFWSTALANCMQMLEWVEPHDQEALESLVDVRAVYSEKPLGFTVEFEFADNAYFTNKVLTRSYVFDDNVAREDLYINTGLSPKTTSGCKIEWKEGKNLSKKQSVTVQRNKKTGERRKVTQETGQETFFNFFCPNVTDLASLLKADDDHVENEEANAANIEKVQRAEAEYELASLIRTRVIPRAVLLFTGEEDSDMMYGSDDEDDFDDEDDDDEGDGDHGEPEEESDESDGDAPGHHGHNHKKGGANNKVGKRCAKGHNH